MTQMFPELSGKGRHYATYQRAVRAALAVESSIRFIIAAAPTTTGATVRFFPVFLPTEEQVQAAIWLTHDGYHIARM